MYTYFRLVLLVLFVLPMMAVGAEEDVACPQLPCVFDGAAVEAEWATVDIPPTQVSAPYPYQFVLDKEQQVQLKFRAQVWGDTDGSMVVAVNGQNLYAVAASPLDAQRVTHGVSLGLLAPGVHTLEIFTTKDSTLHHIDSFEILPSDPPASTAAKDVSEAERRAELLKKIELLLQLIELLEKQLAAQQA
jgi:hypothetical protein